MAALVVGASGRACGGGGPPARTLGLVGDAAEKAVGAPGEPLNCDCAVRAGAPFADADSGTEPLFDDGRVRRSDPQLPARCGAEHAGPAVLRSPAAAGRTMRSRRPTPNCRLCMSAQLTLLPGRASARTHCWELD
jgi:hypothetical protein